MVPSTFSASFAGVPVAGTVALDLRSVPQLAVAMGAENVDLGAMLRTMRLADDLDARVEALRVQVLGRGSTLTELLAGSSIEARLEGGAWRIRGPAGRRVLADIRLKEAYASAPAGSPLTVRVDGTLGDAPIAIRVTSGTLADFGPAAKFAPLSATAETAGARLALDGRVALPVTQTTAVLKFVLSGDRLDTLNGLAGHPVAAVGAVVGLGTGRPSPRRPIACRTSTSASARAASRAAAGSISRRSARGSR